MDSVLRLRQLLLSRHPCIAIETFEEADALLMVREAALELKLDLWVWTINGGLRDGLIEDATPVPDTENAAGALYHLGNVHLKNACVVTLDVVSHLKDERTLRAWRDLLSKMPADGTRLVMIDHQGERPAVVQNLTTPFYFPLPDTHEIEDVIRSTLRRKNEEHPLTVDLSRRDLDIILRNLRGLTRRQARQIICDCVAEDYRLDAADIGRILAEKRRTLMSAGLLEYVEAPVDLGDIGGLARLKSWLQVRTRALAPEAVKFGLEAPRGILLLGVQGAGKSLAAKAVATAWQIPLLRMDVGALYDKYIGESERRLRDSLLQAEMMAPVVLWIDEIEKAFASAASRSSDGGLSQRMFGSLLTWLQEKRAAVFIVATANDIEALPPELLRKGRFDEIFFVDLPGDDARRAILEIHLRKRGRNPAEFDLPALVAASRGRSGAEIEQAVLAALHDAFAQSSGLTTQFVVAALAASPPLSVTMREKIESLRGWAQGRCVPSD
jgi:hypothetical protein